MVDEVVTTRVADDDDLPEILALYEQLADSRSIALPAAAPAAIDVFREIGRQGGRTLLIAAVDGAVAGTADVLMVPNLTHGGKPWIIVENVVVARGLRRAGVGRVLMTEILRRAERAGCYKIQLLSRKGRSEAHSFYVACGFEPVAEGFRRYLE